MIISQDNVIAQMPNFLFWKDINSVFLGCNDNFAKAAGLRSPKDIIGKTDYDLAWGETHAKAYQQGDHEVLDGLIKSNEIETQYNSNGKFTTIIINKIPLLDSDGQKNGILGTYMEISSSNHFGAGNIFKNKTFLSKKLADCLYFFAKGMTNEQISDQLELTLDTICDYIKMLKIKLNCTCKSSLMIKAWTLDFIKIRLFDETMNSISNHLNTNMINQFHLSKREVECFQLTVRGNTAKQIAATLGISHRTVETHLDNLKVKLNVPSKGALIDIAFKYFIK